MTRRELWEMIGRGEVGEGGDKSVNSILNTCFAIYCSLLGDLCTKNIIKKKKRKEKKRMVMQSTEQALNETVAKKSRRYLLANPDRSNWFKSFSMTLFQYDYMMKIKLFPPPPPIIFCCCLPVAFVNNSTMLLIYKKCEKRRITRLLEMWKERLYCKLVLFATMH